MVQFFFSEGLKNSTQDRRLMDTLYEDFNVNLTTKP